MLIQTQYNNIWTINLGLPLQNIPCFYKYLQREVYFQDYLDLFGSQKNGRPTFERLEVQGHQTVSIQGLRADPNNVYTALDENGEVRLIVDYDYPFDRNELCKDREIKYLLIGEAAPTSGSYIYKDAKGSYITAPLTAIGLNETRLNRTQRLLEFANNGFLLLDFFPFAINFTSPGIVLNNMIIGFFIHLMNLKINSLTSLNKATWDFCLVGPKRTSLPILNWLDTFNGNTFNGKPTLHQLDLIGANFIDNGGNVHSDYTNNLNILAWPISHLSKRAKFTVAIGGSGPNSHLIRRVFYLP